MATYTHKYIGIYIAYLQNIHINMWFINVTWFNTDVAEYRDDS
jgi:hypothetical protein